MGKPWEKYQGSAKPWERFQNPKTEDEQGLAMKGLSAVGKGLDYAGGVTRAGAANLAGVGTTDDLLNALKANPASTAEYLKRTGLPEGYSLSDALSGMYSDTGDEWLKLKKGGALDPTARGAAGFVGDVALDPLTYLSGGLSAAAKGSIAGKGLLKGAGKVAAKTANAFVNPLEHLAVPGEAIYKSGLKKIDTRLIEKGQEPISDYLLKQGNWGRLSKIQEGMQSRMDDLANQRSKLYSEVDASGAKIDPMQASKGAYDQVAHIAENPYMAPKAEKARDFLDLAQEPMSVQKASDVKTSLYDALPENAFNPDGSMNDIGKKIMKELSLGYKNEIEAAGNFARPGLGQEIGDVNKEWGALIGAQKPTKKEIAKDARKDLLTQTKLAAFFVNPLITAGAYGGQLLNATPVRTGLGLGMDRLANMTGKKASAANALIRRSYWDLMNQDKK